MLEIIKKNWVKNKVITLSLFGAVIALTILITISYKNIGKQNKPRETKALIQNHSKTIGETKKNNFYSNYALDVECVFLTWRSHSCCRNLFFVFLWFPQWYHHILRIQLEWLNGWMNRWSPCCVSPAGGASRPSLRSGQSTKK